MKKLFALALAALLLLAVPSYAAAPYVDTYFSCFFDGYRASKLTGVSLGFDSMIIDVYFPRDEELTYYTMKKLSDGVWTDTGTVSAVYADVDKGFTLTMPDGSVFPGYFDFEGDEQCIWLDIGAGYFRLHRVREVNLMKDWTKK